jgi:thiol reductant ABC exporter CydC subunit
MRQILWRLLKLAGPFKWWMALAALLGFATIGSSIGLMATSAYLISRAALHPSIAMLQVAIVGVRFFGISRGVFRYLERYISHQVTFRLLARLRVWFYQAVEPLAPARLMQYRSGDLLSRVVADIENLEHFYGRVIAPPAVAGLVALLMWILLAAFDTWLAIVSLVFLLLAGVGLPILTRLLSRGLGRQMITTRAELNVALVDGIQGLADLLITGREVQHQQRVQRLSRELVGWQQRMAWLTGLHTALSGLLANWSTLAILLIAIPLVSQGQLEGVYLALLVLATLASFEAVLPLPEAFQHLESSVAAAGRLFELVDAQPSVPEPPTPSPQPKDYSLVVENLQFCYAEGEPPALSGLSFNLPQGRHLAIVGPSGAGKSSLIHLLLRFWEYQVGQIWLGGHDLRHYRPEDVRQMMSVVSQHTHLFNGTIRENLLIAHPGAREFDIIQAARQAHLHEFIQTLAQGYDTWIGEQGLCLSGGERQRLAIARALLKDAPILILDEPTTNLDAVTEQEVLQAIHTLMAGRTTLMITHRLVGLENMDEILVLQAGRIVERGQPYELLQAEGLYRQMWQLQHNYSNLTFGSWQGLEFMEMNEGTQSILI